VFAAVFPAHLAHLEQVFADFTQQDYDNAVAMLQKLKSAFQAANSSMEETA
jgi:hypothetical protein